MASLNSEIALVKRVYVLCNNYENRPLVARHNTLPALTRFLGSNNRETRRYCLLALHLLAQHPENVELISWNTALVKNMFKVYKDTEYDDPELHDLVNKIFDFLAPALLNRDPRKPLDSRGAAVGSSDVNGNGERNVDVDSPTPRRAPTSRVLRGVGSDAMHTVILEIPALNPHQGDDIVAIEDIFHTTRGVISYSIFMETKRVRLFMTSQTTLLQEILLDSGFESVVIQDEMMNQDVFTDNWDCRSSNNRSCYDDDTPSRRPSYLESITNGIYKSAMVLRRGGGDDTLSSRVQQQRAREQKGTSALEYVAKQLSKWW